MTMATTTTMMTATMTTSMAMAMAMMTMMMATIANCFPSRARCRAAVHLARARPQAAVASARRKRQLGAFREHASAARFQQRCGTARGRHALTRFPADGKGVPPGHARGSAAPLRSATSCDLSTGIRGDSSSPGRRSAVEGGKCTGSGTNTGGNGS